MLANLTSYELAEWIAYYKLEPFGEQIEWLRTGVIASVMANIFGGKKRKFKPIDFMPDEPKPAQTATEMKEILLAMMRAQKDG